MVYGILVVGQDPDFEMEDGSPFPKIISYGENEQQAVEIFATLYNAHILTSQRPCEEGAISNTSVGGTFACTYISGITDFKTLAGYFRDVHGVKLKMESYE